MESEQYFSCHDLKQILAPYANFEIPENGERDRWWRVNFFRDMVHCSLDQGLHDILKNHPANSAIVEVGSGKGYKLQDSNIIRLQPNETDLYHLVKAGNTNTYPITIKQFTDMVGLHPGKSVSLYLGVNVFDAMMPTDRELNLSYIAKTQTKGGQILMVLDANPELGSIISEINSEYPDMIVLPYIPTGYKGSEQFYRMSAVLFPKSLSLNPEFADFQIFSLDSPCVDSKAFDLIGQEEKILRHKQLVSNMQLQLEKAKEAFGLKVIPLEEYFVEKTKKTLERLGYSAKSYYYTSFCEAPLSTFAETTELKQPIVYKTDFRKYITRTPMVS